MNKKELVVLTIRPDQTLDWYTMTGEHNAKLTLALDFLHGATRWAVVAALPADFSTDTYTITDGQLVKASAELLAERQAARRVAEREAIRAERERRYQSEPIASLYWTWIESGVEADRSVWIAAKEAVRLELPYPETQEGGAQ